MSKPSKSAKTVVHARPAAWAQALFAGSLLVAGVVAYLLAAV